MSDWKSPENVLIVYFSGTGCTRLAVEQLEGALRRRGVFVRLHEIHAGRSAEIDETPDMLIVMYPVYAFNAPKPVDDYIKKHAGVSQIPAGVISVSGGGEVSSNRACRQRTVRCLEKKGFRVVYEYMLVMPANCIEATPFDMCLRLIRALPEKADRIAADLTGNVPRRSKPGLPNRFVAALGNCEKWGAVMFGRHIKVGASCTGCAVCAKGCPTGNITMADGRPIFANKCATCLRCIYACPVKALTPGAGKFLILKDGFSLPALTAAAGSAETPSGVAGGFLWAGLKKYLEENT